MAAQGGVDPKTFNYADPEAKEKADGLLRRSLKPYKKMVAGEFALWNLCIVLTNCAALGLGAYFQHHCWATDKAVMDIYRVSSSDLTEGIEAAVMEALRGKFKADAIGFYNDLGAEGPDTGDGEGNQVALLLSIVYAFLELPKMAPFVGRVLRADIKCATWARVGARAVLRIPLLHVAATATAAAYVIAEQTFIFVLTIATEHQTRDKSACSHMNSAAELIEGESKNAFIFNLLVDAGWAGRRDGLLRSHNLGLDATKRQSSYTEEAKGKRRAEEEKENHKQAQANQRKALRLEQKAATAAKELEAFKKFASNINV